MITIPVRVCGDVWCDPEQFVTALRESEPEQPISIDLRAEGPSLAALGVLAELRRYCQETQHDPNTIHLINAPNNSEITEFTNTHSGRSHFLSMSSRYWRPLIAPCSQANRFAMFVGRTTVARCSMMFELVHEPELGAHFKFSTMNHDGAPIWEPYPGWRVLESFDQWMDADKFTRMKAWWQNHRPPSLDRKQVRDQYSPGHNTNASILDYYVHFHVELIAETYTLGDTFFPTEKTIRPIMAARPFLIYAAPGFLQRLRQLGFRTYQDCWNEDYDRHEGAARWHSIKTVIQDLCAMDDSAFGKLMIEAHEIAWHNRCVLADMILTDKVHLLRDQES